MKPRQKTSAKSNANSIEHEPQRSVHNQGPRQESTQSPQLLTPIRVRGGHHSAGPGLFPILLVATTGWKTVYNSVPRGHEICTIQITSRSEMSRHLLWLLFVEGRASLYLDQILTVQKTKTAGKTSTVSRKRIPDGVFFTTAI